MTDGRTRKFTMLGYTSLIYTILAAIPPLRIVHLNWYNADIEDYAFCFSIFLGLLIFFWVVYLLMTTIYAASPTLRKMDAFKRPWAVSNFFILLLTFELVVLFWSVQSLVGGTLFLIVSFPVFCAVLFLLFVLLGIIESLIIMGIRKLDIKRFGRKDKVSYKPIFRP